VPALFSPRIGLSANLHGGLNRILSWLSATGLVAELAFWAACQWGHDESLLSVVATHAPPLAAVAFWLALATFSAFRRALTSTFVSLVALGMALFPVGSFACHRARDTKGPALSVLTYNVEKWSHGARAVARVLESESPDVFCLQEAGSYDWLRDPDQRPETFAAALAGYQLVRADEVAIGTRLPVLGREVVPLPVGPSSRPLFHIVLQLPSGRELSVMTAHLLYTRFFELSPRGLVDAATARRRQAESILDYADRLPRPAILCGDFNASPRSAALRVLERRFDDAWSRRGFGFGTTTFESFASRRLDYVLVRGLDVLTVRVPEAQQSDHRPVAAMLSPPDWP
jgi:endonuclease/exonuclease/phosphatase (EEP) superfamily protein YafD